MDRNFVASVDIGTTKVVMAVAKKVGSKVKIVALQETASQGVIKGDVRNLDSASRAIAIVKQQLEKELSISIPEVSVGLSGQHISCTSKTRDVSIGDGSGLAEITQDDMDRLRRDTLTLSNSRERNVITILPQSFKVDSEDGISDPIGMEGSRLEGCFNVIEGEAAAIDRVRRCFQRARLSVGNIHLQPLASSDAVLYEDEKELGVAVVDIGGGTTDICIYSDKVIRHVAVLAIGGTNINSDIKSVGILERQVEKLKTLYGEAVASETNNDIIGLPSSNQQYHKEIAKRTLAQIIEARMLDIVNFVKEEIEKSMNGKQLSAGIVLTGGGANLTNIAKLFSKVLQCQVRIARPDIHLDESDVEKYSDPKYSTIIGMLWDELKDKEEKQSAENPVRGDNKSGGTPVEDGGDFSDEQGDEYIYDDSDDGFSSHRESWFKRVLRQLTSGPEEL